LVLVALAVMICNRRKLVQRPALVTFTQSAAARVKVDPAALASTVALVVLAAAAVPIQVSVAQGQATKATTAATVQPLAAVEVVVLAQSVLTHRQIQVALVALEPPAALTALPRPALVAVVVGVIQQARLVAAVVGVLEQVGQRQAQQAQPTLAAAVVAAIASAALAAQAS
jgi:hypothetical protein